MNRKTLFERFPTDDEVASACLSYDHSFGLMDAQQQQKLMFEAKEWFHSWKKEQLNSLSKTPEKNNAPSIQTEIDNLLGTPMNVIYCGLKGWGIVTHVQTQGDVITEITVRTETGNDVTVDAKDASPEKSPAIRILAEAIKQKYWKI